MIGSFMEEQSFGMFEDRSREMTMLVFVFPESENLNFEILPCFSWGCFYFPIK